MKRTYPANIDGQIFYIDEDAFLVLQNYLTKLRESFPGEEGQEIVSDIESRIRELFNEKFIAGAGVIVIGDVQAVIHTMGRPEEISAEGGDDTDTTTTANTSGSPASQPAEPTAAPESAQAHKKLFRNMQNKVFGGVVGGLATYMGWNANIMRILIIILALSGLKFISGWFIIIAYLVGWMVIPPARTPRQILEMKGDPVNVDTVQQTIISDTTVMPPDPNGGSGASFLTIVGKCVAGLAGFLTGSAALMGGLLLVMIICGAGLAYTIGNTVIIDEFGIYGFTHSGIFILGLISGMLLAEIILILLTWLCSSVVFNSSTPSKKTVLTLGIICFILLVCTITLIPIAVA